MPDPYADILGLPAHMRPPTHYQLLGIACGEMDAESIRAAAQRQLHRLRPHAQGELADDCRMIAREIKEACRILLDPAARQRYDLLSPDAAEPWYAALPESPVPAAIAQPVGGTDFWDEIDREESAGQLEAPPPAAPLPDWLKEPAPTLEKPKPKRKA